MPKNKKEQDKDLPIKPQDSCPVPKETLITCAILTLLMGVAAVLFQFGLITSFLPGSEFSIINYWALFAVMLATDIILMVLRVRFLNKEKRKNGKLENNRNKKDRQ